MANNKGFTLIEIIITLSLFTILSLIAISIPFNSYYETLLKSTAVEIKEALHLAQQLSLDESRSYCVDLLEDKFRVKEDKVGGKVILSQKIDKNISKLDGSQSKISYNRNGETSYSKFTLVNKKGQKIVIDTLIGTGKVRISEIY